MKSTTTIKFAAALALAATAPAAMAHPGHSTNGFAAGVQHPISGIDHVLAMIAVGLFAAQLGGRALWLLPAMFLTFMVGGGLVAASGTGVPMVEQGIAASVLVLGLLIAAGATARPYAAAGLVAVFAMFHGYAHGAEMHAGLSLTSYAVGFVVATAVLIGVGTAAGLTLRTTRVANAIRISGAAIALCGVALFFVTM